MKRWLSSLLTRKMQTQTSMGGNLTHVWMAIIKTTTGKSPALVSTCTNEKPRAWLVETENDAAVAASSMLVPQNITLGIPV